MKVGCTGAVNVISGLPAETSAKRIDVLDDERRATGFSITGGEHRLGNCRSVTSIHGFDDGDGEIRTVVLESHIVDVPEGNTEDDTRLFADTVVKHLPHRSRPMLHLARSTNPPPPASPRSDCFRPPTIFTNPRCRKRWNDEGEEKQNGEGKERVERG
ncbi:hypothetical protein RYX36_020309 [Vicia faba]